MPEEKTKEVEPKEKTPALEDLKKQMLEKDKQLQQLTQIIKNPGVQKTLKRLQDGKEIVFQEEKAPEPKPTMKSLLGKKNPEDLDVNALDNQELLDIIAETVGKTIEAERSEVGDALTKQLGTLGTRIEETQKALLTMVAQKNYDNTLLQYPDMPQHSEAMQAIMTKYPTLSPEDAYKLVKADLMIKAPARKTTESEKPESPLSRAAWAPKIGIPASDEEGAKSKVPTNIGGRRRFQNMLAEVTKNRT